MTKISSYILNTIGIMSDSYTDFWKSSVSTNKSPLLQELKASYSVWAILCYYLLILGFYSTFHSKLLLFPSVTQ